MPFRIDRTPIIEREKQLGWCQEMKLADIQKHLPKKENFLTRIFRIFKKKRGEK